MCRTCYAVVMGKWLAAAIAIASTSCASSSPTPPCAPCGTARLSMPTWIEGTVERDPAQSTTLATPKAPITISLGESGPKPKRYVGKPIDLDVKDADIVEVCRLLSEVGHVNIVVADDVKGSVTLKMTHVPWDQALDAILKSKGYAAEREGNVIAISK